MLIFSHPPPPPPPPLTPPFSLSLLSLLSPYSFILPSLFPISPSPSPLLSSPPPPSPLTLQVRVHTQWRDCRQEDIGWLWCQVILSVLVKTDTQFLTTSQFNHHRHIHCIIVCSQTSRKSLHHCPFFFLSSPL